MTSRAELFTAIVDLERLLDTEKTIAHLLDNYILTENQRLAKLQAFKDNYERIHRIASKDSQTYLSNPVNAYLLVKRLTTDWKTVENLVVTGPAEAGRAAIANLTSSVDTATSFPSAEDLSGAADALIRLQDTYKLDTSSIARGQITTQYSHDLESRHDKFISNDLELTAGDCLELGRHAYNMGDHYHTILWMKEARQRLSEEKLKTADEAEILEYLAFSTFKEGNIEEALDLTYQLLAVAPDHPRAVGNRDYYVNQINTEAAKKRGDDGEVIMDAFVKAAKSGPKEETEREIYEGLCRGEKRMPLQTQSKLKCFYWDTKHAPYLTLMNIKVEEAFKKPQLLVFYDVMSDQEIQIVKEMSGPRLRRATVQNSKTGELETAKYRIGKSAWLSDSEHEAIHRVNKRIEYITGLTTKTAEELQVVNYGIGGHYDCHYDFARKEETNAFKNLGTGNRIATWLNYMSDVEAGGATVFPELGVTIWPQKGSAAFWYNLHKSGEGDMLTRHAACPVLVGSKWIANKWFHERGQEFRRPCGPKINS
jgi:prolyl 4-hydroxylase